MSKNINTGFNILAPEPVDSRTVKSTYADLAFIPVLYIGLKVYIIDTDKTYIYKSTGWVEYTVSATGSAGAVWGSITGNISDQADLVAEFLKKFDKTGGTITGSVIGLSTFTGSNFILDGSTSSAGGGSVVLDVTWAELVAIGSLNRSAGQVYNLTDTIYIGKILLISSDIFFWADANNLIQKVTIE